MAVDVAGGSAAAGEVSRAVDCFHCGLPVPAGGRWRVVVESVAQPMCCAGCAAVAQTIVDNGLVSYYRQRSALPALDQTVPQALRDLAVYDHDRASADDAGAAGLQETALILEGISCAACVWLIEQRVLRLPGVAGIAVNFTSLRARLRWDPRQTRLSTILAAISEVGYRAYPYERERAEQLRRRERNLALWRLFIAGFGMMQVMMYLIPVYLAAGDMTADVEQLMRLASLILTAPVVLFSAAPFFAGAWRDLRNGRPGMDVPVALGIGAAFAASLLATWRGSGAVYFDSVTMFVFLLLAARYFEMMARTRSQAMQEQLALRAPLFAERLTRWPAASAEKVAAQALREGDFVRIGVGATVPADGVLVEGDGELDEALLTGEARPQLRRPGDCLTGGSYNLGNPLVMRVTGVGAATRLAVILRLAERAAAGRPRLALAADRVARQFVVALLAIAAGVAAAWWLIDPSQALTVTVAVLVVSCPCALSLATPAALGAAGDSLHRAGVLVTRGDAIEGLATATDIVFDKTGTLTTGRMQLRGVLVQGAHQPATALAWAAALETGSNHPVALALRASAATAGLPAVAAAVHVGGAGVEGGIDGARVRIGSAAFVGALTQRALPAAWPPPAAEACVVYLGDASGWIARIELADSLRASARELVARITAAGLRVHLLSGDRAASVAQVARALGIEAVRAEASAADKCEYVRQLQRRGGAVVMVGDGVNDAAGLSAAQVSVAMGGGAEIASGNSDVVLLGGRIESLGTALDASRRALRVIRQNLAWAFGYNALAVPLAACGAVTPLLAGIGMAASSALVIANALRLLRLDPRTTAFATGRAVGVLE
jgi:Cu2+-exporting ATPase